MWQQENDICSINIFPISIPVSYNHFGLEVQYKVIWKITKLYSNTCKIQCTYILQSAEILGTVSAFCLVHMIKFLDLGKRNCDLRSVNWQSI